MAGAGFGSRLPRWPVTLAVAGVVIVGGAAAIAKWPHAWWWLIVVMVVAAAIAAPALAVVTQALQRRQEMARTARIGLQGTTGVSGGGLPSVLIADLEARVHRAVLPIPYIRRDDEYAIGAHLKAGRPILLIGSSMVGKTKMAAHIIGDKFSSWPVVIPDSKTALADLDAKDVTLSSSVIWLDDIERLIGPGGITEGALQRLSAARNVLIGTIRASAYQRFRPSDQLRPPEWDVLSTFERVFVSRKLTVSEQRRLAQAVPDAEILKRISTVGLGEYAGAAAQVAEALKLGAAGSDSVGYALVLAAADWRRCGLTRPVPVTMLPALAKPHLDQRWHAKLNDQEAFSAGLAWATRDINPSVALLQPAAPDSYSIYDFALDLISHQDAPVPLTSWAVVMTVADASELVGIGYTAEVTYRETEIAIQAFRQAARSGHTVAAPMAARNLGVLLAGQGDFDDARSAYQQAIDSGHADAAPVAEVNLGNLLVKGGDADGARSAYQQAIDSGHAVAAPMAARNLGLLLGGRGDADGARSAHQQAIDSGHADAAPMAEVSLGDLLAGQGDIDGARSAYQQAIDSGHAVAAPMAARNLGLLLGGRGDADGARSAHQQAIDSGHADAAPMAIANLATPTDQPPGNGRLEQQVTAYLKKSPDGGLPFPVLEEKLLPPAPRRILQSTQRDVRELPQAYPGTALVFQVGARWAVFDSRKPLTGKEKEVVDAVAVSLVDLRMRDYSIRILVPSASEALYFIISATFQVQASEPEHAAAEGQVDIERFLEAYLMQDSDLFRLGTSYHIEELTEFHNKVTSRIEANWKKRPVSLPGLSLSLGSSAVFAPRALRREEWQHEYQRLENSRAADDAAEWRQRLVMEGREGLETLALARSDPALIEAINEACDAEKQAQAAAIAELIRTLQQNGALDYVDIDIAGLVSRLKKPTERQALSGEGTEVSDGD